MVNSELGLRLEEAVIGEHSVVNGKAVMSSCLRQDFGVIIIAIKRTSGKMIFNPGPPEPLSTGDVIVVIGKRDELKRMNQVI